MRLDVLGCSGTYPAAGRPGSGYLVREQGSALLLDAGPGTFLELAALMDPLDLDAIVLSHVHPDHCSDFFALWHYYAYGPGAGRQVALFAPEGAVDRLTAFIDAESSGHPFHETFAARVVDGGDEAGIGPVRLGFATVEHSVPGVAVRAEADGRSLTYTGDTGPAPMVEALAAGTDVLLCEATYVGDRSEHAYPFHLTAGEAGSMAQRAAVGSLVLTHIPPDVDAGRSVTEASRYFDGPVSAAAPGMEVTV